MAELGSDTKEEVRKLAGKAETRSKARELAFRAIQRNPGDAELRLLLAKLFYLDGLFEFAARELIEVQHLQPTPSVEKLLEQFTEFTAPLLGRLKHVPWTSGAPGFVAAAGGKDPAGKGAAKPGQDEIVADLDVDIDLFDE